MKVHFPGKSSFPVVVSEANDNLPKSFFKRIGYLKKESDFLSRFSNSEVSEMFQNRGYAKVFGTKGIVSK